MIVKYLQSKLNELAPDVYEVSREQNVKANYDKVQVVVSALSGSIYKDSSTIPYQIDIITNEIDRVMADFMALAKQENTTHHTEIIPNESGEYQSVTITPYFNSPFIMQKDLPVGQTRYAKIVVFCTINEVTNVSNVKEIKIDGEIIERLNASIAYTSELHSNRKSGKFLNRSRMKSASCVLTFTSINKSTPFFNRAFKVFTGELSGNTGFLVEITLDNGLKASFKMLISTYTISSEISKLPSVNIAMFLYDEGEGVN